MSVYLGLLGRLTTHLSPLPPSSLSEIHINFYTSFRLGDKLASAPQSQPVGGPVVTGSSPIHDS